jgi:hypothetical protein
MFMVMTVKIQTPNAAVSYRLSAVSKKKATSVPALLSLSISLILLADS